MAVLGVLVRLRVADRQGIVGQLEQLDGVTAFSINEDQRVGLVIEGATLDEAHTTLTRAVESVPGVLGTWPVFAHTEPDSTSPSMPDGEPVQDVHEGAGNGQYTP